MPSLLRLEGKNDEEDPRERSVPALCRVVSFSGPRLLIRLRKRAVSVAFRHDARPRSGQCRARVQSEVKASKERKNNKNYEESRGSPPGYESRATE